MFLNLLCFLGIVIDSEFWCQYDMDLTEVSREPWNPSSEIPFEKWLDVTQSAEAKERLLCLGNIVVPKQAAFGARILGLVSELQ